jgi:ATP-dependent Clp protease ATP-binding subunit ClpA
VDEERLREIAASLPPLATMVSPDVARILAREQDLARLANRPAPTLEDLVRAIAQDPVGGNVLRGAGADLDILELSLAAAACRIPSTAREHELLLRVLQLTTKANGFETVTLDLLLNAILQTKSRVIRILGMVFGRSISGASSRMASRTPSTA